MRIIRSGSKVTIFASLSVLTAIATGLWQQTGKMIGIMVGNGYVQSSISVAAKNLPLVQRIWESIFK